MPIHLNTVLLFRLLDKQLVIPSVLFYVITLSFVLYCAVSEVVYYINTNGLFIADYKIKTHNVRTEIIKTNSQYEKGKD